MRQAQQYGRAKPENKLINEGCQYNQPQQQEPLIWQTSNISKHKYNDAAEGNPCPGMGQAHICGRNKSVKLLLLFGYWFPWISCFIESVKTKWEMFRLIYYEKIGVLQLYEPVHNIKPPLL